ncbi:uncharacterized protein V6R79_013537 [Siganus canaliculatus]
MEAPSTKVNPLMHNLHDYYMTDKPVISIVDPKFPPLPATPASTASKRPAPKKRKTHHSLDMDENIRRLKHQAG